MKPVLVIWNDAHAGTSTWERIEDLVDNEPYEVKSVGFLMTTKAGGKRSHVSITQSWSADGCVDSVLHIPVAMVQQVINLIEETVKEEECISIPVRQIPPSTSWSGSRPEV